MKSKRMLVACVIVFVLTAARCKAQSCRTRDIPFNIFSHDQNAELSLSPSDLDASAGRQRLTIAAVMPRAESHKIVLLSDVSGSMLEPDGAGSNPGSWYFQWELAADFISAVPGEHEVGLAVFAGRMRPLLWPTRDRAALMDQIQSLELHRTEFLAQKDLGRETALWDAIREAVVMFGPFNPGDAVYVISDADDNASKAPAELVKETLLNAGIRLFTFRFIDPGSGLAFSKAPAGLSGLVESRYTLAELLRDLAGDTGGWVTSAHRPRGGFGLQSQLPTHFEGPPELRRTLDFLYWLMEGFYTVRVAFPAPRLRSAPLTLSLRTANRARQRELTITYPRALMPCTGK